MSRRLLVFAVAALATGSAASPAHAAGPEAVALYGVIAGPDGVSTPKSPFRYVSMFARKGSVVAKIRRDGGQIVRSLANERGFSVPAVAADGSASGLSADGRTLVLVPPRVTFPRRVTRLAIVDTERFRITRTVELLGDFNFDAISPDGNLLYFIEFKSRRNPLDYAVRAYDLRTRRLDPKPVVDPHEPDEEMRGFPVTRAASADGRWAYTLYQGGEHPFIHALDTAGRTARCIDLPTGTELSGDPAALDLRLDRTGRRLTVTAGGEPSVVVSLRTFRASVASLVPYEAPAESKADDGGSSIAIMGGTGLGLVLLAGAGVLARRRRLRRR